MKGYNRRSSKGSSHSSSHPQWEVWAGLDQPAAWAAWAAGLAVGRAAVAQAAVGLVAACLARAVLVLWGWDPWAVAAARPICLVYRVTCKTRIC